MGARERSERQPGYYWVRCDNEGGWQPGEWQVGDWLPDLGQWWLCGADVAYSDDDFEEIGAPIVRTTKPAPYSAYQDGRFVP